MFLAVLLFDTAQTEYKRIHKYSGSFLQGLVGEKTPDHTSFLVNYYLHRLIGYLIQRIDGIND